jgi:hypothetical protein
MATFVADCPRCNSKKANLDCYSSIPVKVDFDWKVYCEVFAVCRVCHKSSILLLSQFQDSHDLTSTLKEPNKITGFSHSLTDYLRFERFVTSLDNAINEPPAYLPDQIDRVMREGNKCLSALCWNAAGSMYRLALDLATKGLLPDGEVIPSKVKRSLGLRLDWLFDNGHLPEELRSLAECVQQDGNDGAHDGTLTEIDASDLHDFSFELLRRLYTEPERIAIANRRRAERRGS